MFGRVFSKVRQAVGEKARSAEFKRSIAEFCGAVGMFYVVSNYVANVTICVGPSMMPTLDSSWNAVVVDMASYNFAGKSFEVGDVVIASHPFNEKKKICKRVRGMPGDTIFSLPPGALYPVSVKIPAGHVWLAGDNPLNSSDSRSYGPVPIDCLQGRVLCRLGWDGIHKITKDIPAAAEEPAEDEESVAIRADIMRIHELERAAKQAQEVEKS